jgi:hypothetical protein
VPNVSNFSYFSFVRRKFQRMFWLHLRWFSVILEDLT